MALAENAIDMRTPNLSINNRDDVAPAVLVQRAMKLLADVGELLESLSPEEITKTASRAHLDRRGDAHAAYWRLFGARHRALTESLAARRAGLAVLAHAQVKGGAER